MGENKIHNKHTSVHVQMEHFLFRKGAWGAHCGTACMPTRSFDGTSCVPTRSSDSVHRWVHRSGCQPFVTNKIVGGDWHGQGGLAFGADACVVMGAVSSLRQNN